MQQSSGQSTVPALPALLQDGVLAGEWVLDPHASSVRLKTAIMGVIPVRGSFRELSGNGAVSPDGAPSGTLRVATASIDTKNEKRDTHLRSADFFDSTNNPDMTFTTHDIRPSGAGVVVTGALTVRGHTRPLSFVATSAVHSDDEVWLDAEVFINRRDFGVDWNWAGLMSMKNTVTVHAVFTRP
jgi:polyisoprenoid-binding protein YceI